MTDRDRSEERYWGSGCSGFGARSGCGTLLLASLLGELILRQLKVSSTTLLVACGIALCVYLLWRVGNRRQRARGGGTARPVAQGDGWYPPVTRRTRPPAGSGPAPERPDAYQGRSSRRRGLDAGGVALAVAAASGFVIGTAVVARLARDVPYWSCYAIVVILGSALLGYALGVPHARSVRATSEEGILSQIEEVANAVGLVLGCVGFVGLVIFMLVMEEVQYGPGGGEFTDTLVFVLSAGPFYTAAFALLFHLLRARLGWDI
jgi:hypothetical protein